MQPEDGTIVRIRNGGKYLKINPVSHPRSVITFVSNLLNFVFPFIPLNSLLVNIFEHDDTIPVTNAPASM
jgi:hypothetical protein